MVDRFLLGERPLDNTFGLDISKAGFDVKAFDPLTNPEAFCFSTKWDRLERIIQAGAIRTGTNYEAIINVHSIGFFPIMTFCIMPVGSTYLVDEGWYKFAWAANPGYSSRLKVYGRKNASDQYEYAFRPFDDYFTSRVSIQGDWGVSYILWDLKAGEFD